MRAEYLYLAIIFFSFIALILVISMLLIVLSKKGLQMRRRSISNQLEPWIMDIILEDTGASTHTFLLPDDISLLLEKKLARKVLLRELMKIKKSLSGVSGDNIEKLYNQLNLQEISLQRITSKFWHVKAKGIQELATMNQHVNHEMIFDLTNDKDHMVRMEAQTAMVRLQGYHGLQFFNTLTYPLTEWHQVNILYLLANQPITENTGVVNWLNSPNASVVQFSLKLISEQHAIEFYDDVVKCLEHPDENVRKQAILCLGQIPSSAAATELNAHFKNEDNKNLRICIINEFIKIGAGEDISFLKDLQHADDVDIKLAANRTVLHLQKN